MAGATCGAISEIAAARNVIFFHTKIKCVSKARKITPANGRVRDDHAVLARIILGSILESTAIVHDTFCDSLNPNVTSCCTRTTFGDVGVSLFVARTSIGDVGESLLWRAHYNWILNVEVLLFVAGALRCDFSCQA